MIASDADLEALHGGALWHSPSKPRAQRCLIVRLAKQASGNSNHVLAWRLLIIAEDAASLLDQADQGMLSPLVSVGLQQPQNVRHDAKLAVTRHPGVQLLLFLTLDKACLPSVEDAQGHKLVVLLPDDRRDETLSFAPHGVELEGIERAEEDAHPAPIIRLIHLYLIFVVLAHFAQPLLEDLVASILTELHHLFVQELLSLNLIVLGDPGRQIGL